MNIAGTMKEKKESKKKGKKDSVWLLYVIVLMGAMFLSYMVTGKIGVGILFWILFWVVPLEM